MADEYRPVGRHRQGAVTEPGVEGGSVVDWRSVSYWFWFGVNCALGGAHLATDDTWAAMNFSVASCMFVAKLFTEWSR